MHIFLYGPPGSGKTTHGRILSERLSRPLVDLDQKVEEGAGMSVRAIFEAEGEVGFRAREAAALRVVAAFTKPSVIALGGGALLDLDNRAVAEAAGQIVFLDADMRILERRCASRPGERPLLSTGRRAPQPLLNAVKPRPVSQLLAERADHYASFKTRVKVENGPVEDTADTLQATIGLYRITGMGTAYDAHVGDGLLAQTGDAFEALDLGAKTLIVGDTNTIPLYGGRVADTLREKGIEASCFAIPAGESAKTIATVSAIWAAFAQAGIERKDSAIALGGGVVGDLTGFAAATWMRGIRWVNLPTTLLAMVDAGIGGKTGADLPEGKNLVGAFHAPSLVIADASVLASLPTAEIRCGLAEAIKHAIIGAPALIDRLPLFACCADAPGDACCPAAQDAQKLAIFAAIAMAVKIRVIRQDPFEKDVRAMLNLGHTVGHALETLTKFTLPHGHAVAIGTVAEARIAEAASVAPAGFADKLAAHFASVGLPTALPPRVSAKRLLNAMRLDKKTAGGEIRFALPARMGKVRINQVVSDDIILQTLSAKK